MLTAALIFALSFEAGVAAYEGGDVNTAVTKFEQVLAEASAVDADAATLYNYGNALARSDRWAEALVAYRSAQMRSPRDRDVRHNIRIARKRLGQETPGSLLPPFVAGTLSLVRPAEAFWFAVFWIWLWCGVALVRGLRGSPLARRLLWIASAGVFLSSALLAHRVLDEQTPRAVVVVPTSAQSDPSAGGAALFTVPAGSEVVTEQSRPEWTRIQLQSRWVWIRTSALRRIE